MNRLESPLIAAVHADEFSPADEASRHVLGLSPLGLGTAQLGNLSRETTQSEAEETVQAAWEGGLRYFDTAPHYGLGLSELRLGNLLAQYPRDKFVVSTKVGRLLVPSPETAGQLDTEGFAVPADQKRVWDFSRDGILRSVEASLNRLGLDRIDVLYLHDPDNHFSQASTEGIETLAELRDQGLVSAIGAGMNDAAPLAELIERADIDLVMCAGRFTLLDSSALDHLLPIALSRGVGVVAAGVFNSGLLASPRPQPTTTFDYQPAPDQLVLKANLIADICEAHGVTLPAAALGYVSRHPAVVSTVVGARGRTQVDECVARAADTIPAALWTDLERAGLIPEVSWS